MQLIALIAQYSNVLFIVAIIAMFARMYAVSRGNMGLVLQTNWVSLIVSIPLALLMLTVGLLSQSILNLLLGAVWGWVAYSSFREIRNLRGRG